MNIFQLIKCIIRVSEVHLYFQCTHYLYKNKKQNSAKLHNLGHTLNLYSYPALSLSLFYSFGQFFPFTYCAPRYPALIVFCILCLYVFKSCVLLCRSERCMTMLCNELWEVIAQHYRRALRESSAVTFVSFIDQHDLPIDPTNGDG